MSVTRKGAGRNRVPTRSITVSRHNPPAMPTGVPIPAQAYSLADCERELAEVLALGTEVEHAAINVCAQLGIQIEPDDFGEKVEADLMTVRMCELLSRVRVRFNRVRGALAGLSDVIGGGGPVRP